MTTKSSIIEKPCLHRGGRRARWATASQEWGVERANRCATDNTAISYAPICGVRSETEDPARLMLTSESPDVTKSSEMSPCPGAKAECQ